MTVLFWPISCSWRLRGKLKQSLFNEVLSLFRTLINCRTSYARCIYSGLWSPCTGSWLRRRSDRKRKYCRQFVRWRIDGGTWYIVGQALRERFDTPSEVSFIYVHYGTDGCHAVQYSNTSRAKYFQLWTVIIVFATDCCRPYRRHWKRVARLHSVTVGGFRVRGVAYLQSRIYVIYSNCNSIGVYHGQQPFDSLNSICLPDAR